jgi:four helix bundle protein
MIVRPHFRFEDLDIWQLAKVMAVAFHKLADRLEGKRLYRYAEQLRGAALSVPNNIAEGSASPHVKELQQFLNIARRSLFENASMLLVFDAMGLFPEDSIDGILSDCDRLSRMITRFCEAKR